MSRLLVSLTFCFVLVYEHYCQRNDESDKKNDCPHSNPFRGTKVGRA